MGVAASKMPKKHFGIQEKRLVTTNFAHKMEKNTPQESTSRDDPTERLIAGVTMRSVSSSMKKLSKQNVLKHRKKENNMPKNKNLKK
ncbi:hypothetical protein QTP70_018474 [Hemibagrus guttatus]|uniref:Uncharacterized protein n=1 Tax=Hemibagrus guttatus TaxID=175788 RepID=A0AAE0Q0Y0_9TELE|nr:hypothetical protein QTP70_018474 [Hemibagrus guttatus]